MAWLAAGFLFFIYCLISLLRRKFSVPMTRSLLTVIVVSLLVGATVYFAPCVYLALNGDDSMLRSALYITNSLGIGIGLCGSLLGCIAQGAQEWGVERRTKRMKQPAE